MSNPRPNLNNFLNWYTERKVKTRREMKTKALECWQPIVKAIVDYVKRTDDRFASLRTFPTGSYYEGTKVKEPNEFDLMLVMEDLPIGCIGYRTKGNSATDYTPPLGFVRVSINIEANRLKWKRDSCLTQEMLNASQVKAVLRRLVGEAIVNLGFNPRFVAVKSHGPAITLYITNTNDGTKYSVDLTLAIKFIDWPDEAIEWITRRPGPSLGFSRGWPNSLLLQEIRDGGCHLVAKQPKGDNVPEDENGIFWRFSFSAAEKKLFLLGGHGEASSCRKQVLRILKALREELHLHPLTSYHLKTILLHECEAYPHPNQWSYDSLSERFLSFLQRLEDCLRQFNCPHYFITHLNLFEFFGRQRCDELAKKVKEIILHPEVLINLIK